MTQGPAMATTNRCAYEVTVERGASARSARQPRLRLAIEPIYGLDVGLERAYLLNGAIGPFSFEGPLVAVT